MLLATNPLLFLYNSTVGIVILIHAVLEMFALYLTNHTYLLPLLYLLLDLACVVLCACTCCACRACWI